CLRGGVSQLDQSGQLHGVGLDRVRDLLDWPAGQCRCTCIANDCSWFAGRPAAAAVSRAAGVGRPLVSIGPVHADVEIVIGIGPERIVGVRPEREADEVPPGKRPEQSPEPTDDNDRAIPEPPSAAMPVVPAVPAMPIMIPVLVCKFLACKFSLKGCLR